jgi:hypothetical protein
MFKKGVRDYEESFLMLLYEMDILKAIQVFNK